MRQAGRREWAEIAQQHDEHDYMSDFYKIKYCDNTLGPRGDYESKRTAADSARRARARQAAIAAGTASTRLVNFEVSPGWISMA